MRSLAAMILLFVAGPCMAQADTLHVLTQDILLRLVLENHPAVRQAMLRSEMGEAAERSARGGFDPMAVARYREKRFEEVDYFNILDVGLRVPTWYGVELFGGYEDTRGLYLDPQNRTPGDGLVKAGAHLQLGQGLFIDRRRAELQRALALRDMVEAERIGMLNDILFEVLNDHMEWVAAWRRVNVATIAVGRADIRMQAVRGSFIGGDRPAIDTLEALLQVQDRQMRLQQAGVQFQNAGLVLSNHLWDQYMRPLEIGPNVVPDTLELNAPDTDPQLEALIAQAFEQHPLLLEFQGRLRQLEVDRRFRAEMIKPQLDLSYMFLSNAGVVQEEGDPRFSTRDRQWGLTFSMPLLLRRERGELAMAGLRVTEGELDIERLRLGIRTTIGRRYNELALMRQQVELGAAMVENYRALFQGETTRFEAGESSLFLVNQREVSFVDSRFSQVDLELRLRRAFFLLDRDAGVLWRNLMGE
jgi:outer membrane protein TolC